MVYSSCLFTVLLDFRASVWLQAEDVHLFLYSVLELSRTSFLGTLSVVLLSLLAFWMLPKLLILLTTALSSADSFLLSWHQSQYTSVKWEECLSAPFTISNGVRQAGVLSLILFTIYIDDLLTDLASLGVGCFWNSQFAVAMCYSDDLVLLAPTPLP